MYKLFGWNDKKYDNDYEVWTTNYKVLCSKNVRKGENLTQWVEDGSSWTLKMAFNNGLPEIIKPNGPRWYIAGDSSLPKYKPIWDQ